MPLTRRPANNGFSWLLIASMLGAVALPLAVRADDGQNKPVSKPAPKQQADDADLMEFLGSIGSEDERWIDYLAKTDPTKVASTTPPASSGGGRSDGGSGGSQNK